jgi:hypothetical protein
LKHLIVAWRHVVVRERGVRHLKGAVRNVHRGGAKDAERLQLVSPRALCLGGEMSVSQVNPEIEHSLRASAPRLK